MGRVLQSVSSAAHAISSELLLLLRRIAMEPILAVCKGDTAVGRTLETVLNIQQNSSKTPDYKGIELKSYRGESRTRANLFAQVPNWEKSYIKSSAEMLQAFGYQRERHDRQLNCEVSALRFNSLDLRLSLDVDGGLLSEVSEAAGDSVGWWFGFATTS